MLGILAGAGAHWTLELVVLKCPVGTQDVSVRNVLELAHALVIVWYYDTLSVVEGTLLNDLGTTLEIVVVDE